MSVTNMEAAAKMDHANLAAQDYRQRAQLIAGSDAVVAKYLMDISKAYEGLAVHYKGLLQQGHLHDKS